MPRTIWKCNCPICRLLVHKVMNKVISTSYGTVETATSLEKPTTSIFEASQTEVSEGEKDILSEELREKIGNKPVEIIKLSSQEPVQTPQPSVQEAESEVKHDEREKIKQETQPQVPSEVMEKISTLENEVSKIKKYVKASVDGIKATLVDLRSAMAELSNPFNILRKYADLFLESEQQNQPNIKHAQNTATQLQPTAQPIISVIHYPTSQGVLPPPNYYSSQQMVKEEEVKEKKENMEEKREEGKIGLDLYIKLAEWVNKITKHIPPDTLEKLIDNYVDIGVIDKNIGTVLKKIIKTINEIKSSNLSINEQAKYLHELIQTLGLTNGDVAQKVLPATEKTEEKVTQELLELVDQE